MAQKQPVAFDSQCMLPDDVFYTLKTTALQAIEEKRDVEFDEEKATVVNLDIEDGVLHYEIAYPGHIHADHYTGDIDA